MSNNTSSSMIPNKIKPERLSLIKGVGVIDEIRRYKGEKIISMTKSISIHPLNEEIVNVPMAVDIYYTLYLPVPLPDYDLVNNIDDKSLMTRLMIIQNLLASSKLQKIKNYTTADSLTSMVAAASFLEKLNRFIQKPMSNEGERSRERERNKLNSESQESSGSDSGNNENELKDNIEKALEKALEDAKTAKEIKGLIAKIGAGNTSILSYTENPEEVLKLARETDISKILEKLSGVKLVLSRKSKEFRRYSKGWLTGIEYGRDLERLHHSQLALPEEVFIANFANDKLLLFEKSLNSNLGPIYVLLDKSGSMIGDKIYWARAVAVALLQRSISEGREFYVRFFDSMTHPLMKVTRRSKPNIIMKVLTYLATVRAGGGTSITNAIFTAAEDLKKSGRKRISDVILITDGEDKINLNLLAKVKSESKMRLHTVMVQGINQYLKKLSDRYLVVKKLDSEGILKVVDFTPSEAEYLV
jgi:uncharacterized protein with von Willebrand factor type A (vWA) domain